MVATEAPFRLCLSVPLVLEYEAALRRSFGNTDERIEPVLDYLCSVSELTEIYFLWRPFLRDPGDEMVRSGRARLRSSRTIGRTSGASRVAWAFASLPQACSFRR